MTMENTEAELENAFLSGGLVGYYDHFNSAGESASEISSTPSSVSSETAVESAEDPGPPSAGQPHRPLRHRPLVQLQRLDEQGVIGACRRGRKRGRKNRTQSQRMAEVDDKRVQKNARERERVSNVNAEYKRLREALGDVDDSRKKKYHKLRTLTAAINYIQAMMAELDTLKREGGEADEPGPSPSDGSYPVAVEPEGQLHVAGGYDMQHCPGDPEGQVGSSCHSTPQRPSCSPPINLSCEESLEPNEEAGSSSELELHTIIHHEEVYPSVYPEEVYPCSVVPPQGSYFTMVCSPEPSYMTSPVASSTPQTLLAPSPGGNDLMFSSVATPVPLQTFSSPEAYQPLPLSIPPLSCEAEPSTGYAFPMQPDLPEAQHSWSSTPLSSPPTLSHYNYPPSILHS